MPKSAAATGDFFSPAGTSALVAFCYKSSVRCHTVPWPLKKKSTEKELVVLQVSQLLFYLCRYAGIVVLLVQQA